MGPNVWVKKLMRNSISVFLCAGFLLSTATGWADSEVPYVNERANGNSGGSPENRARNTECYPSFGVFEYARSHLLIIGDFM